MKDKNMFFTSIINLELWDKAGWKAAVFGGSPDRPPVLGIGFTNKAAAEQIFKEWRQRFGAVDTHDEIRVSIIEGPIPGEDDGYTVHINTDVDGLIRRTQAEGRDITDDLITVIGRFIRMNPAPGSKNLEAFKKEYEKHQSYYLVPCFFDRAGVALMFDYAIAKKKILFRQSADVTPNDLDYVVFRTQQ